jgi:hypothetical protein
MHPIGRRVLLDGVTLSEYATQSNMNKHLVSDFVTSMARMYSFYFPDVLSVIQDVEADSSALPCKAMAGKASGGPGDGAGGIRFRVGFSIDMSVDIANATHYDVGVCSQGISVWLEEMPGLATGWYFVMPNMYCCIDGRMYNGIAIRLCHGTAISWDGRVVKHDTSVSHPDGLGTPIVGHRGVQYTARALSVVSSSILQLLVSSTTIQWPCIVLGYTRRLVIKQYSVTIHH